MQQVCQLCAQLMNRQCWREQAAKELKIYMLELAFDMSNEYMIRLHRHAASLADTGLFTDWGRSGKAMWWDRACVFKCQSEESQLFENSHSHVWNSSTLIAEQMLMLVNGSVVLKMVHLPPSYPSQCAMNHNQGELLPLFLPLSVTHRLLYVHLSHHGLTLQNLWDAERWAKGGQ